MFKFLNAEKQQGARPDESWEQAATRIKAKQLAAKAQ
jgi:hypothetical protein